MDSGGAAPAVQRIGGEAPDFSLPDLQGATRALSAEMAGRKGAVVVFWSCVCSHCVRYDDYLSGFAARHPELALLAVASRQQETPADLLKAARERNLTFPILVDSGGVMAARWFVQQTPRVFLVGADRLLQYRGAIDNFQFSDDPGYTAYLEPAVADLLAGRPVALPETPSFGCAIRSVYYQLQKIL
jgi:peroxiredoxin